MYHIVWLAGIESICMCQLVLFVAYCLVDRNRFRGCYIHRKMMHFSDLPSSVVILHLNSTNFYLHVEVLVGWQEWNQHVPEEEAHTQVIYQAEVEILT
jgi:hypothetical protein